MKNINILLLMIIMMLANVAAATVLEPDAIVDGQLGSPSNPIEPYDFFDVYLVTNSPLFSIGVVVSVNGPADIISATGKADADEYGWSDDISMDAVLSGNSVELGLASPIGSYNVHITVAKITFQSVGPGDIHITIANSGNPEYPSQDWIFGDVAVNGNLTVFQMPAPEPTAIVILMAGIMLVPTRKNSKNAK